MHTPVHESALCTHHTPLHTNMIIHTELLIYTHIHKILPHTHHTPLHPHTNIHTKITMYLPVTHTIIYSENINYHNLHTYSRSVSPQLDNVTPDQLHDMEHNAYENISKEICTGTEITFEKLRLLLFLDLGCDTNKCDIRKRYLFDLLSTDIINIINKIHIDILHQENFS